ncbi:MAG TPA: pyridoxamine 5'-phosphate oxidase family protein [Lunatimonas sp.]|nr:pyridoxamine 5'-phosphate oxidase family protein [Lunatimonas sp.]
MSGIENISNREAINKLKQLVEEIDICLFCTNLKKDDGETCRPMSSQKVCEEGNIWFFSEVGSIKNREIEQDNQVRLFYSHPGINSYLVVNGEAELVFDRAIIEELWSPSVKAWFPEGKDDPNISVIKVKPTSGYYWDTKGSKMVNFFRMVASAASGKNLIKGNEGTISI